MKKYLIFILVMGLALIFTGCGANKADVQTSASTTQTANVASSAASQPESSANASTVSVQAANPNDILASLALTPGLIESADKGPYVDLLKAIAKQYTDGSINIEVSPITRAQQLVAEGKADIYMPKIISQYTDIPSLPYNIISKPIGQLTFVLYSNVNKKLAKKDLDDALSKGGDFPYKLEATPSVKESFKYPYTPSTNPVESLKKLDAGRIDGLIWAQEDVDSVIRGTKDKNIYRSLFYNFDDVIAVAKNDKSDKIIKALTDCIGKLEASGELKTLYANCHKPYEDWQPADMGW